MHLNPLRAPRRSLAAVGLIFATASTPGLLGARGDRRLLLCRFRHRLERSGGARQEHAGKLSGRRGAGDRDRGDDPELRVRAGRPEDQDGCDGHPDNKDTDTHTVTGSGSGAPLHPAPLTNGATHRYVFAEASAYACFCTIPPFMAATVEVTP
jgi:hypothetical protein